MVLRSCFIFIFCFVFVSAQFFPGQNPFLQAKMGGGFRAYMPDGCDMENFEFQALRANETEWIGGNVTKPESGLWTYEEPSFFLSKGDQLKYRSSIKQRGRVHRQPDSDWTVPELVDEFAPPQFGKRPSCNKDKQEAPEGNNPSKPPFKTPCPWLDVPRPGDSRETVLEKQLVGLQCEMASFMDRSARLQYQLTQELTELKKLNYAAVARMQRLESLVRSIPRSYPSPSYPFI